MKIGELNEHCGNCSLVDLCGDPFESPELCTRETLADVEEEAYLKIAESLTSEEINGQIAENKNDPYPWDNEYKGAVCDLVAKKLGK